MVNEPFPEILAEARKRKVPWMDIALAVRELETSGAPTGSVEPPIRMAERLSGYSSNQLRRMLAALGFLDELTAVDPELRRALGSPRFSHAEMLAKIWRADRGAVLDLLRKEPVLRYQSLYQLHEHVQQKSGAPPPMAAGKRASAAFKHNFLAIQSRSPDILTLFGNASYTLIEPRAHHRYAKPALLLRAELLDTERSRRGQRRVCWAGIDFMFTTNRDDPAIIRHLLSLATEASFFDGQLVVIPEGPALQTVVNVIDELRLPNFVVIAVSNQTASLERMSLVHPSPDRRDQWYAPHLFNTVSSWIGTTWV
tara:strand:+ start:18650 stop:19582 length:933 start_codon:yes stop_codon:yes gene_type:complete